jgi:uncharacterized protein (DUF305 family)
MRQSRGWSSVAFVAVGALLLGCSGAADAEDEEAQAASPEAPRIIQPGAPGEESRELDPSELEAIDFSAYTDADVEFMQGMIPHHVQALRMTSMVPSRTAREDVPLFAERMDISQEDEITLMRDWLEERDEEVPSLLADHDHGDGLDAMGEHDGELMPGMLTEEEMAALEAADGEEFDRLFIESMMLHHMGALQMVQDLFDSDGGQEPEIAQFANHVYSDQEIEILRMIDMLEDLGGDPDEVFSRYGEQVDDRG